MSYAVAKLYEAEEETSQWTSIGLSGVLCVTQNNKNDILYMKLFDIDVSL